MRYLLIFLILNSHFLYGQNTFPLSGNAGIGTTTPKNVLDLGSATANRGISWGSNTGNYANIWTKYSSSNLVFATGVYPKINSEGFISSYTDPNMGKAIIELGAFTDPGDIKFYTNPKQAITEGQEFIPTERMRIKSNGNVGIGTTSPTAKLEVAGGTVRFTENWFPYADGKNYHRANEHIFADAGGGEKVKIMGNGNVGIGTTTPAYMLDIKKSSGGQFEMLMLDNSINGGAFVRTKDNSGREVETGIQNGNWTARTNYIQRLTIDLNGNVGIGTTTPATKLDVVGSSTFGIRYIRSDAKDARISVGDNSGTTWSWSTGWANAGDFSLVEEMVNGNRFYVQKNTGYIGMGTSNPKAKLEISNDANISSGFGIGQLRISGSTNSNRMLSVGYDTANNNGFLQSAESGITYTSLALNPIAGNVGVGTSNPQAKFHIMGDGNQMLKIESTNVSHIHLASPFGNALINNYNDGSLRISNEYNSGATHLVINSSGNIGVGTASVPTGYKLAVSGSIIAEKVKVKKQSSGWPDFVFSPSYKLPTLTEVENFVKQNQHLPEIPSASEIEKGGQDLGEMNRLLLKKVEELTLYLIEQQKEIKTLKLKVENLEKR